ncbi:hypothetical protein DL769_000187 [Monosporascus sp. CRB-8-3]|nr:hypothetical protein DL769_000187 [Monosporascus sp. CRB-8-3]
MGARIDLGACQTPPSEKQHAVLLPPAPAPTELSKRRWGGNDSGDDGKDGSTHVGPIVGGVVGGTGVVAIAGGLIFFLLRRKRNNDTDDPSDLNDPNSAAGNPASDNVQSPLMSQQQPGFFQPQASRRSSSGYPNLAPYQSSVMTNSVYGGQPPPHGPYDGFYKPPPGSEGASPYSQPQQSGSPHPNSQTQGSHKSAHTGVPPISPGHKLHRLRGAVFEQPYKRRSGGLVAPVIYDPT